jgi:hypothetical protein
MHFCLKIHMYIYHSKRVQGEMNLDISMNNTEFIVKTFQHDILDVNKDIYMSRVLLSYVAGKN